MRTIDEQIFHFERGGILYDAARVRQSPLALFDRSQWMARDALHTVSGGRGEVAIVGEPADQWIWRRYRRGGLVGRVIKDRYVFIDAAHTRSFAEWRLLAKLSALQLPVPAPIAARYVRSGWTYQADLMTAFIPQSRTLAQRLSDGSLGDAVWRAIGATVSRFHRAGVHHADLNAHNILLRDDREPSLIYLIDFDRGRIRSRGSWEQAVLTRLQRSLLKLQRERSAFAFSEREWKWLLDGYAARV